MPSLTSRFDQALRQGLAPWDAAAYAELPGASEQDVGNVLRDYPNAPVDLIELLRLKNGTPPHVRILGWRNNQVWERYCLNNCDEITANASRNASRRSIIDVSQKIEPELFDTRIDMTMPLFRRLFFASDLLSHELYVDFDPAPGGTPGQVLRFSQVTGRWDVISPGFAEFLLDVTQAYEQS